MVDINNNKMRVHTINRMTKNPNGGYKQQQDEGPYYQQDDKKPKWWI